jgi:flavin reductase (DIM6/NTAB) family NADH-FMN oxidoreductase RutF
MVPATPRDGDDTGEFDRLRRRVLWSMPTGLYVIGSRAQLDGEDRRNLMTANLVVQVAVQPKLVAAAIDAQALTRRMVEAGGCFSISLLSRDDRAVVRRFVKPVSDIEVDETGTVVSMAGEAVHEGATGAPLLARAVSWLDCEVRQSLDLGSHILFVGEVVAVGGPDGDGPPVLRMEDTRMNYGG